MTVKEYLSTLPKSVLVVLVMNNYAYCNLEALQHKVKGIKRDAKLLKGSDTNAK